MENPDGNIGRLLRERREELGYTLQEAEEETRIRKTYLESLENNRFSELPGQAYVTGFIRVYARYLGLKVKPLLALLNDLQSLEPEPVETVRTTSRQTVLLTSPSRGGDWRKFFLAFILVMVLGGLLYFLPAFFSDDEQVNQNATKATETVEKQVDQGESHTELEQARAEPVTSQTEGADQQGKPGEPEEAVPVEAPVPDAVEKQQNQVGKALPQIPYNGASLRMLALADSSLIITVDTRKPHQYKLHDGLDLTWKVKERVSVEFAASDVARFWLNGQEIDIAGSGAFELQPAGE